MELKLNIPNSLNEITLGQYQEFEKLDLTNDSIVHLKMIEIFCKVPEIVVRNINAKDVTDICDVINNMFDTKHQLINSFKLGKQEYGFIPNLDDMSFGEYIDLDTYIGDTENMHIAMNVLYRPIKENIGDKYLIKEYDVDAKDKLEEIPMDVVFGAIFFFVQFRDRLIKGYDGLFGGSSDGRLDGSANFSRKYGWYQSIFSALAQNDVRRLEDITKLNVHKCLYALEYMKEKSELEANQIKKNFK